MYQAARTPLLPDACAMSGTGK